MTEDDIIFDSPSEEARAKSSSADILTCVGLSKDTFAAIGKIAAYWGTVENYVSLLIARHLHLTSNKYRHAIAVPSQLLTLRDILTTLNALEPAIPHIKSWPELSAEIDRLRIQRNNIVHAHWGFRKDEGGNLYITGVKRSARGKIAETYILPSAEQIKQIADEIQILATNLSIFDKEWVSVHGDLITDWGQPSGM